MPFVLNEKVGLSGVEPQTTGARQAPTEEGMRKPESFKRFEDLLRRVLSVPKEEIDKREAEWKKGRISQTKKPGKSLTNRHA